MKLRTVLAAVLFGAVLAWAAVPTMASARDDHDVDPLVAAMLDEVPGGVIVDATHAVWPALDMALSVPSASDLTARSVGSCATGRFCAYNALSLAGGSLSFGGCGVNTVPPSFTVRSVANARSAGYVQARNGATVLKTVGAGNWANVSGTVNNLRCAA
ncbi:hypothetical protein LVJ59_01160 [Microbacterium sp. KKR3/1]|uniref:hypothetical protein n=1 Tax=Microbacterium sp. KKR3/1 TaxID=2904241 RepID=UPI001E5E3D58|nr:hypothetical protein [Microbacterium sp. KKR3/1]MCE0507637.1 hypothetical protein [Microbacterium sp. KKR3/1]